MAVSELDITLRLFVACILGGLIGLERESLDRPAGFRTHILVCVGSALIMIVSMYAFAAVESTNKDPGRIAAQVVSGIGFLGAGTIIKEGSTVKGLTTAASLWVVSGIGLAIGSGFYFAGIIATAMVFLTLVLFGRLEKRLSFNINLCRLKIIIQDRPGQLGKIGVFLGQYNISIKNVTMNHLSDFDKIEVELVLRSPANQEILQVLQKLAGLEGVLSIERL